MTQMKYQIKITAFLLTLVFANAALAADQITNENKNNSFSNTISDANNAGNTVGGSSFNAGRNVITSPCDQQQLSNRFDSYQQIKEQYQQKQQAQLEAYNRFIENRKQQFSYYPSENKYIPSDIQARGETYIEPWKNVARLWNK